MSTRTPQDMADELSGLLRDRLGIRGGDSLSRKLVLARTLLPGHVRRAIATVAEGAGRCAHPRLMKQVDLPALEAAHAQAARHLRAVDPKDRRTGMILGALASLAVNLLLLGAGLAGLSLLLPL